MTKPDFEALRAERNRRFNEWAEKMRAEGWEIISHSRACHGPNACYCDCGCSDPKGCEHDWDGPEYKSEDGSMVSATCSRCGMTAFSHSMRFF